MSLCVPSCDSTTPNLSARSFSNASRPDVPMLELDYEVAELTWENGHLAMHGLGLPRVPSKHVASNFPSKDTTWEKPRASGTLESIVNQATRLPIPPSKHPLDNSFHGSDDFVPWFDHHPPRASSSACSTTMAMDALVPCANRAEERGTHLVDSSVPGGIGIGIVGSCSVPTGEKLGGKRARVARAPSAPEGSSREQNGRSGESTQHVSLENSEREVCVGFTSTSFGGSYDYTSSGKPPPKTVTVDENDSVCHSTPQREAGHEEEKKKGSEKSSVSTKRSRAAAIHNQSERKRRDKINQRMKTLQKLVPNSSKTDKASMLDEVIEYLKQLQAQVQMMNRMNLQPMMLPMALQQQLQMSVMAPMSMGMGIGMGMSVIDINGIGRPNIPTISPPVLHPTPFMPMAAPWNGRNASGDRLQPASTSVMPDPLSVLLACQSQPMTMDAYNRMAALYQQMHQQLPAPSSNN